MTVLLPTYMIEVATPVGSDDGYGGVATTFGPPRSLAANVQVQRPTGDGSQTDQGGQGRHGPGIDMTADVYVEPDAVAPGDRLTFMGRQWWASTVQPTLDPTGGPLACDVVTAVAE